MKVPEAVGIVSPPIACAVGRKGLREEQALLEQNIASYLSCCMNHGHRVSAGGLSQSLRVGGHALSGLTAKCPGTGGLR